MGVESASYMETKEFCDAPCPSGVGGFVEAAFHGAAREARLLLALWSWRRPLAAMKSTRSHFEAPTGHLIRAATLTPLDEHQVGGPVAIKDYHPWALPDEEYFPVFPW